MKNKCRSKNKTRSQLPFIHKLFLNLIRKSLKINCWSKTSLISDYKTEGFNKEEKKGEEKCSVKEKS